MIESIINELKLVPLAGEGGMYRYLYAGEKDSAGRESYSSIYSTITIWEMAWNFFSCIRMELQK